MIDTRIMYHQNEDNLIESNLFPSAYVITKKGTWFTTIKLNMR